MLHQWSVGQLWHYRTRLWILADDEHYQHPYWQQPHSPHSWGTYSGILFEPDYYVEHRLAKIGWQLDRSLTGQPQAITSLKKLIDTYPTNRCPSIINELKNDLERVIAAETNNEELAPDSNSIGVYWHYEYRYWSDEVVKRINTYQPWWSKNLDNYITDCRQRVAAYDAAATTRFKWWHRLVGWWQGISQRRCVAALSDVKDLLTTYGQDVEQGPPSNTLDILIKKTAEVDPTTTDLMDALTEALTYHRAKQSDMNLLQEAIPEALQQGLADTQQSLTSHLDNLVRLVYRYDDHAISQQLQIIRHTHTEQHKRLTQQYPHHALVCAQHN